MFQDQRYFIHTCLPEALADSPGKSAGGWTTGKVSCEWISADAIWSGLEFDAAGEADSSGESAASAMVGSFT